MLDYLNLLENATDLSWAAAKASHAVMLCRMEQGGGGGGGGKEWSDVEKIDRIRHAHAQRHVGPNIDSNTRNQDKSQFAPAMYIL